MKKGMLLSTITMLIVLALSLTTATFAWFSVNTSVTTGDVKFEAQVAKELSISLTAGSGFGKSVAFAQFTDKKTAWNVTPTIDGTTGLFTFGAEQAPDGTANYVATSGVDYLAQNFFLMSSVASNVNIAVQFEINTADNLSNGFVIEEGQPAVSRNYLAAAARLAIVQKGTDGNYSVVGVYAPYQNVTYNSADRTINTNNASATAPTDSAFTTTGGIKSFKDGVFGGALGEGQTSIYGDKFVVNNGSVINIADAQIGEEIEFFAYMWIEGTDMEATNALSGGIFTVRLRFDLTIED